MTSGFAAAISEARCCLPGSPTNSPPAASTNSATQSWEQIRGLPHSSQNTRGRVAALACARTLSISCCIFFITWSPRSETAKVPAIVAMSV